MKYVLTIWSVGVTEPEVKETYDTEPEAWDALADFATGYGIHYHQDKISGTLTTKIFCVNQASYTFAVRKAN